MGKLVYLDIPVCIFIFVYMYELVLNTLIELRELYCKQVGCGQLYGNKHVYQ